MINSNLLKAKIVENGFNQTEVAEKIGINTGTLNLKINNADGRIFTVAEVEALAEVLKLKKSEISAIFFA